MLNLVKFDPPRWQLEALADKIPEFKVNLGRFPTPIHRFNINAVSKVSPDIKIFIKRDDYSSSDLSGNKVRKLEFILASALKAGCDSVITAGGLQSNHARATAIASRLLGLEPHLILRTTRPVEEVGLGGNLLWDRMVGSKIYTIHPSDYVRIGSDNLIEMLKMKLIKAGKTPWSTPVGGSDSLGAMGYIEAIREIITHPFGDIYEYDHIVFGCGSGGTAAGLAIGGCLSGLTRRTKIHGIGVCDSPEYFYDHIDQMANELGIDATLHGTARDWIRLYDGQGLGYAKNTDAELEYIAEVAGSTGVTLDSVYAGKALYHFMTKVIHELPEVFLPNHKILFIHTGGVFGLYDKEKQLLPILSKGLSKTPNHTSQSVTNDHSEVKSEDKPQHDVINLLQFLGEK
jgi:D-cysteine desulfhydrase family pyridoxal phosphate-dependent enzyme